MPRSSNSLRIGLTDRQSIELPLDPHRIIAAWMESDRQEEEKARKEKRQPRTKDEDTVAGRRKLRICDALFKAADAMGYSWTYQCYFLATIWFEIDGRSIRWSLREETRPRRVPLSKAELRDPDNLAKGITMKQVRLPTGMLKIMADTDFGKKIQIIERTDNPLEQRVGEILEKFKALAGAANAHEVELARRRDEWKLEKRAKERVRRLNVMEDARWNYLRELAGDWQAKVLRAFIDTVEHELGEGEHSGRAAAWLEWARGRADWLDPLSDGKASARRITHWRDPRPSEYELTIWDLC